LGVNAILVAGQRQTVIITSDIIKDAEIKAGLFKEACRK